MMGPLTAMIVCHHPHELKDLLPTADEARAEHVVDAEGLARRGGWQGGVVRNVRELLLQLQIVQNEAVAVVGYAQAVRGLAIRGSGEVGADPGGQPGARVGPVQSPKRGVDPVQAAAVISREEAVQGIFQVYLGYPLAAVHVSSSFFSLGSHLFGERWVAGLLRRNLTSLCYPTVNLVPFGGFLSLFAQKLACASMA